MDLKKLQEPLPANMIEFRIKTTKDNKVLLLAYKDARADMRRLDEAVGPLNWTRRHVRDNHNCVVSIWDQDKEEWVSKEDTGTESNSDAEKGLASDSFKRACFNWGIGRELYDYPQIWVQLKANEMKDGKALPWSIKSWRWENWFTDGVLVALRATDKNGEVRFQWRQQTK